MEKSKIKKWIHPLDNFPRISCRASLMEAMAVLNKSDADCHASDSTQKILLVYDAAGIIVGKLSPLDIVEALESHCKNSKTSTERWAAGLILRFLEKMGRYLLPGCDPLAEHWQQAHRINIFPYFKRSSSTNMIGANGSMELAFHLFSKGRHESLFVVHKNEIEGLLLFTDIYQEISSFLKSCPLAQLGDNNMASSAIRS